MNSDNLDSTFVLLADNVCLFCFSFGGFSAFFASFYLQQLYTKAREEFNMMTL